MATQDFDKLNKIKSMPFNKYFGEMAINDAQKKSRITMAERLEEMFQSIFLFASIYGDVGFNDFSDIESKLISEYTTIASDFVTVDLTMMEYITNISKEIVNSTIRNIEDDYTLSDDRARYIAENESNTIMNTSEYSIAKANGMTKKTWVSMQDAKVRASHDIADGQTVDIDDVFVVGTSLLRYPKDPLANASETVNCRCSVIYSK